MRDIAVACATVCGLVLIFSACARKDAPEPPPAAVEEPVEVPAEVPVEVPVEEPVEVPVEEPVEEPAEEPAEVDLPADQRLAGKRVAILIAEGFHDGETKAPMEFVKSHGGEVTVVGIAPGELSAYNSDVTVEVEKAVGDIGPDDFDALVIPGGRSPAALRQNETVVQFVRDFFASSKPVAAICHGPQVLITAGVMDGLTSTGFSEIQGELEEAGATFKDRAVVKDGHLITSRIPADLPEFNKAIKEALVN